MPSKTPRTAALRRAADDHIEHLAAIANAASTTKASEMKKAREAVNALVDVCAGACRDIYYLWSMPDTRELVRRCAAERECFPCLVTSEPHKGMGTADSEWMFDLMLRDLKLAPQILRQKGKRRDFEHDEFFTWIQLFTKAVLGHSRTFAAAVPKPMLKKLRSEKDEPNPKLWAEAFVIFMLSEPYCYQAGLKAVPGYSEAPGSAKNGRWGAESMRSKIEQRMKYRGDKNDAAFANAFRDIARRRFVSVLARADL